jgi:hypothetical protein
MRWLDKLYQAGEAATAVAVGLFAIHVTSSAVLAQNANGVLSTDCRNEPGLTYLCGFVAPEDIVNVGSTGLVLASGHRASGMQSGTSL